MKLRSLLFVPGDRPDRFDKAASSGADALILDLEDSVSPDNKATARQEVCAWLREPATVMRLVRINPENSGQLAADLLAAEGADGIVLPKSASAETVEAIPGQLPILPIATETPASVFGIGSYSRVAGRLLGLTWGAEDLSAAVDATTPRLENGNYTPPYEMVRSLTLFGAHAASVPAIETVFPDIKNLDALAAYAGRGARDGFSGMMAIHPVQVEVINRAFAPTDAEIAYALAVVAAFADRPEAGALQLQGKMIDAPHLKQARRLLSKLHESEANHYINDQ